MKKKKKLLDYSKDYKHFKYVLIRNYKTKMFAITLNDEKLIKRMEIGQNETKINGISPIFFCRVEKIPRKIKDRIKITKKILQITNREYFDIYRFHKHNEKKNKEKIESHKKRLEELKKKKEENKNKEVKEEIKEIKKPKRKILKLNINNINTNI